MVDATMRERLRLRPDQLRRTLDPATLPFQTTDEVPPLLGTIGQPRALSAIEFGLDVETNGYNLFVAGAPGSGRETTIHDYLRRHAPGRPVPPDWVYVQNFVEPERPLAISLPAGRGSAFARDMKVFVDSARRRITQAFEAEDYEQRRANALSGLTRRRDELLSALQQFAQTRGFALQPSAQGLVAVPVLDGKPLAGEDFEKLSEEARNELQERGSEVQAEIGSTLRQIRQFDSEAAQRVQGVDRDTGLSAIAPIFEELSERYEDLPEVTNYLTSLRVDISEHIDEFRILPEQAAPAGPSPAAASTGYLASYRVNVFIDNSRRQGAPVVIERNPSYYNLAGRIDYHASPLGMVTDFDQIRPGALHQANGGFLVVHAVPLLQSPFAWDALKRALLAHEVQIENLGEQVTAVPTARLRPQPIPLSVKVILIGPMSLFHLLYQSDEDFQELFRVKADFAADMTWNSEHIENYAAFISRRVNEQQLRPFDRTAVARVVEFGSRLLEDQRKLSTRFLDIANVVVESSYWAGKNAHPVVTVDDVRMAIDKRIYRSNLAEERMREYLLDGTIKVGTEGEAIGRINGLAVVDLGDYAFGKPEQVSARVSLGRGDVRSIEREIELSGPIHSKGFLILSGYLAGQYGQSAPLSLAATITFEQSYGGVDGDSASSTELYALLSALSGLPLDQSVAVTGSVNQHGEVQAVGGVNQKIEGYFALCRAKGLTGRQGVMLPATNVDNLMLRDEVVEAVRDGRFHIWGVHTIDEGIELLTGIPAGERGPGGSFPEGTVHRLVDDRLRSYAEELREFNARN